MQKAKALLIKRRSNDFCVFKQKQQGTHKEKSAMDLVFICQAKALALEIALQHRAQNQLDISTFLLSSKEVGRR